MQAADLERRRGLVGRPASGVSRGLGPSVRLEALIFELRQRRSGHHSRLARERRRAPRRAVSLRTASALRREREATALDPAVFSELRPFEPLR